MPPPRKSTSRPRPSRAAHPERLGTGGPPHGEAPPAAASSRTTLHDVPPTVPESITWDFIPPRRARQVFSDEDKERAANELLGFAPFNLLLDIANHAHNTALTTVDGVEAWARASARNAAARASDVEYGDQLEREVDTGGHALQSMIDAHVDRAFDTFTAWALRNAFRIPDGLEPVMPWHTGIDFDRARYVTSLPGGEGALDKRLEQLRVQVEAARLVQVRLAEAEAALDRRLEIAAHRRAQVGFVREQINDAGLAPLPEKASDIAATLRALHDNVGGLEVPPPAAPAPHAAYSEAAGQGAWEGGRQMYLSWAMGKALGRPGAGGLGGGGGGAGEGAGAGGWGDVGMDIDSAERAARAVGDLGDVEALGRTD